MVFIITRPRAHGNITENQNGGEAMKYFRRRKINSSNKEFPRERLFKNSSTIYRKAFSFIIQRDA
jgi:hypothetical protein